MTMHRLAMKMVARYQPLTQSKYEGQVKVKLAMLDTIANLPDLFDAMSRRDAVSPIVEQKLNITFGGYNNGLFLQAFSAICNILRVKLYCKIILEPGYMEPEKFLIIMGNKNLVMLAKRIGYWLGECESSIAKNIINSKRARGLKTTHEERWELKTQFYRAVLEGISGLPYNKELIKTFSIRKRYRDNLRRHINTNYPKARVLKQKWVFKDNRFLTTKYKGNVNK